MALRKTRLVPARLLAATCALALLGACSFSDETEDEAGAVKTDQAQADYGYETYSEDNLADSMASNDAPYMASSSNEATPAREPRMPVRAGGGSSAAANSDDGGDGSDTDIPDGEERPTMQLQVVLDRAGFGPGVIDGMMGPSTRNAITGFQQANDLEVTGKMNAETREALARWKDIPATRVVTIPQNWGEIEYETIPDDPAEQAEMDRLGYSSLDEKLAERFHTTIDVLKELNPGGRPAGMDAQNDAEPTLDSQSESYFAAGQMVRVPNIGADRIAPGAIEDGDWQRVLAALGVGSEQPQVDRVVVSESEGTLKAFSGEELVALFTVTTGSENDPLPLGEWDILGTAKMPPFSYQPDLFWDVPDTEEDLMLPPGPNGPVGVVWIDLSKENYGIHGTPEPELIGRTQSHGCVRLTNWDAARLSQMVSQDTQVIFEA